MDPTKPNNGRRAVSEPLLPNDWGVPEDFRHRLGDDVGRQRMMSHEGHLLLVLHAPPRAGERTRRGRLYWREPAGHWRPQPLAHPDHAVGELIGEYESLTTEVEAREESADSAKQYFDVLTELAPLVRSAHNLYTVLKEARGAAREDRQLILLRDRAYALTRRLELLQQDTKNTLDFLIARRAEEQAESAQRQASAAHRLNVLAALFFPLATLTSLLSTRLGHGADFDRLDALYAPAPLLWLVPIGLGLGIVLAVFVSRK